MLDNRGLKVALLVLYAFGGFGLIIYLTKIHDAFGLLIIVHGIILSISALSLKAGIKCPKCSKAGNFDKNYNNVPYTLKCRYCGHEF